MSEMQFASSFAQGKTGIFYLFCGINVLLFKEAISASQYTDTWPTSHSTVL